MRAASCFSGIGAPELGGPQFDWVWLAETEPFPSAVLAKRFPQSMNLGDVTADDFLQRASAFGPLDLLVGAPPCQAFSIAGLRKSLSDDRGNLSLRFVRIAHAIRPRNLLVENVPGWLNTSDNAFGCFLGAILGSDDALPAPKDGKWPRVGMASGPLGRLCWATLDAQYFGVAQRRRRVFVVVDFGDGADPVSVLFDAESLSRHTAPSREAGKDVAGTISARTQGGGGLGTDFELDGGLHCAEVAPTLNAHFGEKQGLENQHIDGGGCLLPPVSLCLNAGAMRRLDAESETLIPTNRCGIDVAPTLARNYGKQPDNGMSSATMVLPVAFDCKGTQVQYSEDGVSPPLRAMGHSQSHANAGGHAAVAFAQNQRDEVRLMDVAGALAAEPGMKQQTYVHANWQVRRLTPTECERLQGFSDGFTDIEYRGKPSADGPRYKALGNSWAVPCGAWIIGRIAEQLSKENEKCPT